MKFASVFAAFACLLVATASRSAAETEYDRTLSVSGVAERSLPADKVEIHVQIRSVREALAAAQESSEAVFRRLAEGLAELGVDEKAVALRNHRLGKEFLRGPNGQQLPSGFYSERDLLITLEDVSVLEAVYTALANDPELRVNHTEFSRKDEIEVRKELREEALRAARQKAIEMAKVFDQFIGKPVTIQEGAGFPGPNQFNTRNVAAFEGGSSAQGRVNLTASVSVTFELTE